MEYITLIGIVIVILGFALKLDNILTIILALVVTALVGGLGVGGLLETLGTSFVANRNITIFITVLIVTGTLERTGLKEAAAALIGKVKGASAGVIVSVYAVMRAVFAAFNISFGGVAGFVRPLIMPMSTAAVENKFGAVNPDHEEQIKGMASSAENVANFFFQVLFIGGSGALLVQGTMKGLGYEVDLIDLAKVEIPVALVAIVVAVAYYVIKDRKLVKKYYGDKVKK